MSKKKSPAKKINATIAEDSLLQDILKSKGKKVEVIAFGVCYTGKLQSIDIENGIIVVVDGADRAMLEIERIESLSRLPS